MNIFIPGLNTILKINHITLKYIIIIFTHHVHEFHYAPKLKEKVYIPNDPLLDEIEQLGQKEYCHLLMKHMKNAINASKPVIELPYNPYSASIVYQMIEHCKTKDATQYLALSFFHTDEDIAEWTENQKDLFLDIKFAIIESMIDYPFIKKIVIPIDAEIDEQFIKDLMKTNG